MDADQRRRREVFLQRARTSAARPRPPVAAAAPRGGIGAGRILLIGCVSLMALGFLGTCSIVVLALRSAPATVSPRSQPEVAATAVPAVAPTAPPVATATSASIIQPTQPPPPATVPPAPASAPQSAPPNRGQVAPAPPAPTQVRVQPTVAPVRTPTPARTAPAVVPGAGARCDPSYPTVCIPPPPPDLDCADIPYRRFRVIGRDPHRFDGDHDGTGCERD